MRRYSSLPPAGSPRHYKPPAQGAHSSDEDDILVNEDGTPVDDASSLAREGSDIGQMGFVGLAAVKFKARAIEAVHRKRLTKFKDQRHQTRLHRHDCALWIFTALAALSSLGMGCSFAFVSSSRIECFDAEVKYRGDMMLLSSGSMAGWHDACDMPAVVFRMDFLLVVCAMWALANCLLVVVEDVDLNEWFEVHPLAFWLNIAGKLACATGFALLNPECWIVVVVIVATLASHMCGAHRLAMTDLLYVCIVSWPIALGLQLVTWHAHYAAESWPLGGTADGEGRDGRFANQYLRRLVELVFATPLMLLTARLVQVGSFQLAADCTHR